MSFSATIRRYRKERGWTLEVLSQRVGLSVAQLSKLETGKSEPSIDSMRRLAAVYGVAVSVLTQPEGGEPITPVRRGGGFVVQAGDNGCVTLRYLTMRRSAKMQPVEAVLPCGATLELGQPVPGDAFFYVVSGSVCFYYGNAGSCKLSEGDSLYFDAFVPHRWENGGENEAVLVLCGDMVTA